MKLFKFYWTKEGDSSEEYLTVPIYIRGDKVIDVYYVGHKKYWECSLGSKGMYRKYAAATSSQYRSLIDFIFRGFIEDAKEVK